jgi:predicted MFS family arabinose efflux permease
MEKKQRYAIFSLIIAGEAIFFLPFVLARIFRPTLLDVFGITNTELGIYFSLYGIVAMVSYLFGGTLADRFSARNLMALALWLTSLGGLVMFLVNSTVIMKLIYAFWGFTTIFIFWAALIRATREYGGAVSQGRAFGWLEGGRGAIAALVGTVALLFFSIKVTGDSAISGGGPDGVGFQVVILLFSVFTFLAGLLVWFLVPTKSPNHESLPPLTVLRRAGMLARKPGIWLLSIMIICAYSGYKITDDFSLFAREVLGYSEVNAAGFGTAALWLRAIVAIMAGWFGDRYNRVTVIIFSFLLTLVGSLIVGTGLVDKSVGFLVLNLILTAIGIYGVRALYFAIMKEADISLKYTGTAVGIISFIGFTPEIFMGPWMGYLLDKDPGATGHQHVFILLAVFAGIGLITSLIFNRERGISRTDIE